MKKLSIMLSLLVVVSLFTSCSSNDDSNVISDDPSGMGVLSLGVTPLTTSRSVETGDLWKNHANCSNSDLRYVRMALKDNQGNCYFGNTESGFHEIEMDPVGMDTNNDGVIDTWNTSKDHKMLLPAGDYTLEYLAVTNNTGRDSKIILMSPKRGKEENAMQYYNLVTNSLPIEFSIREGMEHYIPLEALCFRIEHAFEFGFVFLAFEDPNPFYLCAQ
ncbi:hypothetical protein JM83_0145 [Gillisia sp. Hel_I_86]|uniref:hypothetical protein n=1 Tax=Gillisia sp. Hel_I_86 TaxID=1249981 RepID=UPI00119B7BF5|nr:hypothetical protein [Gillisia sp. Hel_I_86]TVZ25243.1 hypothetical protein JM83_0145 [Gillisia sp. Hel_I_86]